MKKLHKKFSRVIGLILVMAMMLSVGSVFAEDVADDFINIEQLSSKTINLIRFLGV